jgi:hypothetical protein
MLSTSTVKANNIIPAFLFNLSPPFLHENHSNQCRWLLPDRISCTGADRARPRLWLFRGALSIILLRLKIIQIALPAIVDAVVRRRERLSAAQANFFKH